MLLRNLMLDFIIADNAALHRIDYQHTTGTQAVLFHDSRRVNIHHADLRSQNDGIIIRNIIARRTQTVAVQRSTDGTAVSKGHRRRTVPRLNQRVVIFKEGLKVAVQMRIFAPRLRNHHHHRMRQTAAGHNQKLQHIIKHTGIRTGFIDNRHDFLNIIPPQAVAAHCLTRTHPVDVAAQRIDFAVMHQITVGMRTLPAGEGVRAKARMDKRHRRFNRAVLHISVEGTQLLSRQHALINNSPRRQAGNIKIFAATQIAIADIIFCLTADAVQLALEGIIIYIYSV